MRKSDVDSITICNAKHADISSMQLLLAQAGLAADDILVEKTWYWIAKNAAGEAVGAVGLELGETAVLLRSAAVSIAYRGRGLGTALIRYALLAAEQGGYRWIYLFSTDAGAYWQKQGFAEVPVAELVAVLPDVPQVKQYERLGWLPSEIVWRRELA